VKIISKKKLAETVRVLREKNRYTQEKLSDLTGINRAIINKIEREDFIPSITQFEALSDTLNFDPTEMFVETENTNSFVNLKSETLSESEREGVEKLIKMMLTIRQQINIRRAYENELNQTQ
jgi:transcriptional regulator with XRE-family HTH domain